MEENNKQKFELLKPNDDLKNDIQTIKQLLLTRQASSVLAVAPGTPASTTATAAATASATPVASTAGVAETPKEKEEADEDGATAVPASSTGAASLATSTGVGSLPASTGASSGTALKPWEQRRRVRIESAATPPGTPATPAAAPPSASTGAMEEE